MSGGLLYRALFGGRERSPEIWSFGILAAIGHLRLGCCGDVLHPAHVFAVEPIFGVPSRLGRPRPGRRVTPSISFLARVRAGSTICSQNLSLGPRSVCVAICAAHALSTQWTGLCDHVSIVCPCSLAMQHGCRVRVDARNLQCAVVRRESFWLNTYCVGPRVGAVRGWKKARSVTVRICARAHLGAEF